MSRVILHCDMNNFFASVECIMDPKLSGKRVAVCGNTEERHGIILAKNEAAKKLGVKTGEAIWEAKKKCPDLVTVLPHYELYADFSARAKEIYSRFTDLVEPFGLDECWLDVTGSVRLFGDGKEIADRIRNTVRTELGLTISVGVSFNKVFSKLGSDMKKPDAVTVIDKENFKELVYGLPAGDLLGVGPASKNNLHRIGVDTIGELAGLPREVLSIRMGKRGEALWYYANGLENSAVSHINYEPVAKSLGRGTTTPRDLVNNSEVKRLILSLSQPVARNLRKCGLVACGIQLSVRDNTLLTREFQCRLPSQTNNAYDIFMAAYQLFKKRYEWKNNIRSLTVRAIYLEADTFVRQADLFNDFSAIERAEHLDTAVDSIISRYGKNSIKPMSLIGADFIGELRAECASLPGFNI